MSEEQNVTRRRRPWWIIGSGLGWSIFTTIAYTGLLVSTFSRFTRTAVIWDALVSVLIVFLVVLGIISIVYYARRRIT